MKSLIDNGFAVIQNVFSDDELTDIKRATEIMIEKWYLGLMKHKDFWHGVNEKQEKILYRIHNFEKHYPGIEKVINNPKFQGVINEVLGEDATPTVFALIIKMPFNGAAVPWHRDIDDIAFCEKVNISLYLDNSFEANGCLEVVSGTHRDNNDYSMVKSPPVNRLAVPVSSTDIIIHDVRLLHGSGPSTSEFIRRSVVIEYSRGNAT